MPGCVQDQAVTKAQTEAKLKLGMTLLADGNRQAALKTLLEAEAADPENEELQNAIGLAYARFEQQDRAAAHFRKALQIKPGFSDAMNNLGIVYASEGKHAMAVDLFARAAADLIYPSRFLAYNNLGASYLFLGQHEKALQACAKAVEVFPEYGDAYLNMGIAHEGLRQWQEAIDAYKSSIQFDPQRPLPYLQLANVFLRFNRREEARQLILQAINVDKAGQFKMEAKRLLEASERRG
jgi:Tfp pilus assembly protein PilF